MAHADHRRPIRSKLDLNERCALRNWLSNEYKVKQWGTLRPTEPIDELARRITKCLSSMLRPGTIITANNIRHALRLIPKNHLKIPYSRESKVRYRWHKNRIRDNLFSESRRGTDLKNRLRDNLFSEIIKSRRGADPLKPWSFTSSAYMGAHGQCRSQPSNPTSHNCVDLHSRVDSHVDSHVDNRVDNRVDLGSQADAQPMRENISFSRVSTTTLQRICTNVIRNVTMAQSLYDNETIDNELTKKKRWWKRLFRFLGRPAPTRESVIKSLENNWQMKFCGIFPSVAGETYKEKAKQLLSLANLSADDYVYVSTADAVIFDCGWNQEDLAVTLNPTKGVNCGP